MTVTFEIPKVAFGEQIMTTTRIFKVHQVKDRCSLCWICRKIGIL